MAAENSRQREFTELMTDHFFSNEYFQKRFAIMDEESVSDELRNDRASASPRLHGFFFTLLIKLFDLCEELIINKRAFFS